MRTWLIDGNNVFGSRPDGWWNDRDRAAGRLAQRVAEWCRTHEDDVVMVFDPPVSEATRGLAGGNLAIVEAARRGRNAADDDLVELAGERFGAGGSAVVVVTSDRGLIGRLPSGVERMGVGRFRDLIGY
ncbi:MAG: hypothetical protein KDB21_08285 [Acidimicrobiales bacterium]|nr:hypothetical protein [Acidimicrobiales bacterium]